MRYVIKSSDGYFIEYTVYNHTNPAFFKTYQKYHNLKLYSLTIDPINIIIYSQNDIFDYYKQLLRLVKMSPYAIPWGQNKFKILILE